MRSTLRQREKKKQANKQTNKQSVNLSVQQDGGRPSSWIQEILAEI
jgi:hypothetical protein